MISATNQVRLWRQTRKELKVWVSKIFKCWYFHTRIHIQSQQRFIHSFSSLLRNLHFSIFTWEQVSKWEVISERDREGERKRERERVKKRGEKKKKEVYQRKKKKRMKKCWVERWVSIRERERERRNYYFLSFFFLFSISLQLKHYTMKYCWDIKVSNVRVRVKNPPWKNVADNFSSSLFFHFFHFPSSSSSTQYTLSLSLSHTFFSLSISPLFTFPFFSREWEREKKGSEIENECVTRSETIKHKHI